jgi:polyisoprenoid-binding protein YceI
MRTLILPALAGLMFTSACITPALAQPSAVVAENPTGTYKLDLSHASLTWKVSHFGLSQYVARFTKFDATLDWNAENPTASRVQVTIDPTSVATHFPEPERKDFDAELATGDNWINGDTHPTITFVSTSAALTTETAGTVTGDLTFLGVTKPVTLNVTFNGGMVNPFSQKRVIGFAASGVIKRSDFGMSAYIPNIGDEVTLEIHAEFQKQ